MLEEQGLRKLNRNSMGKAHNQKHLCDPKDEGEKMGRGGKKQHGGFCDSQPEQIGGSH